MLTGQEWRKSSYSGPQGCVRARRPEQNIVELGDTTQLHGPTLPVPNPEWARFLSYVKEDA
ncbi:MULTISPECIES: DUF397 domain-containing protein [Nocardiopsis]|uniref:DUF397 domain-containing protein n=1 Tax=Nocardiopsis TaxID=2013 RepID=UPI0003A5680E